MDQDTRDLIAQLCTRAGMIMEDASPIALAIGSTPEAECVARIDQLIVETMRCMKLIEAAQALVRE